MNLEAWLKLFRIGGVTSALSTSSAAWLLQSQADFGAKSLLNGLCCLGFSACLYLFGMAGNDFLDREKDAQLRPERPLPSGSLSLQEVLGALLALLILMVLFGLGLRTEQSLFFVFSAICISLYNGPSKEHFAISCVCIAAARAFNFIGAFGPQSYELLWTVPALCIAAHTVTIMLLAEGEDQDRDVSQATYIWNTLSAASLGLLALVFAKLSLLIAPLAWWVYTHFSIIQKGQAQRALRPKLVGLMVRSFCLLDAVILITMGKAHWAPLYLGLFFIAAKLSRRFPVG